MVKRGWMVLSASSVSLATALTNNRWASFGGVNIRSFIVLRLSVMNGRLFFCLFISLVILLESIKFLPMCLLVHH